VSAWSSEEVDPEPGRPPFALGHLATALRAFLLLSAALSALVAFLAVQLRAALDDADPEARIVGASARGEVDAFLRGFSLFSYGVIGIGILFVVWMWRAAKNNESFDRPGALRAGWAIGGWFVPFGSLVIPAIHLQQLWKGADGTVPRGDPGWRNVAGSTQLWIWWVSYVLAQALTLAGFAFLGQTADASGQITAPDLLERLPDVRTGITLLVAGQVLMILAAALSAAMVVSLTRRQESGAIALGPALSGAVPRGWGRPSPAAWHPDPTGRFDLRYWDGSLWTEHVLRGEEQSTDPV
jgi:hypothetical protein